MASLLVRLPRYRPLGAVRACMEAACLEYVNEGKAKGTAIGVGTSSKKLVGCVVQDRKLEKPPPHPMHDP